VEVLLVLKREAKKRRESIEAYRSAGREEQAEQEEYELTMIEEYLPKQLPEEEVRMRVRAALTGKNPPNFGAAMGMVMKELGSMAEGGVIAKLVKEEYENK
jgi:hypothetical protein